MGVGRPRRLGRVSFAIAVALTCRAGAAAAQEVPATFAPKLVLSSYNRHPAGQANSENLVLSGSASAFEWTWNTRDGQGDWLDDGYFNSVRAAAGSTSASTDVTVNTLSAVIGTMIAF